MIKLVKAELFKEFRKKSFIYLVTLIIFVSILSLVILNRNDKFSRTLVEEYPVFSEEEYYSVNKYGNYKQYLWDYNNYKKLLTQNNEVLLKDKFTKSKYLLSYAHDFMFILGIVIVFISYHSLSYDYQSSSLRYLFMSKYSRNKIFFSKFFTMILISLILLFILIITMLITTMLLTHENIFVLKSVIFTNGYFKNVFYVLEFLKNSLLFIFPFVFVIILSMFLCIIFRGCNFGLVLSSLLYFSSLLFSKILLNYGFNFVEFTFLPYIDFTYYVDRLNVSINNAIYNINLNYGSAVLVLGCYSLIFLFLIIRFLKKDV